MGQIALQARAPQPDLATIERAAQGANARDFELRNAPQRSELEALKLQDEIGGQSALAGYRKQQVAGDPNALDTLKGYPKVQKDMYEVFDGMKPEEYMFAKKKARLITRAAQYVQSIDDKTPAGKQAKIEAWNDSLKVLREEQAIDDRQYKQMIAAGPSDLIIQQALTVDDFVKQYTGKNSKVDEAEILALRKDKIRAEIEKLKTPGAGKAPASNSALVIAANRELAEWRKDNGGTPEEVAAKKAEIWQSYGLDGGKPKGKAKVKSTGHMDLDIEIPQGAIDMLMDDESLADQFDAKYGEGAAESILGGQ
jgi:hypothetical protein